MGSQKQIQIVFYTRALMLPEDFAYGASGMKVPEAPGSKSCSFLKRRCQG
jgi:hypothetical protein